MSGRMVEVPEYRVEDAIALDPATTAVAVIDMQNDFVTPGGSLVVAAAQRTVPVIADLTQRARGAGAKVVYSQDTHADGDPEWRIWPEHARRGSTGWAIVDELQPHPEDLVVEKVRYDAFYGTALDHHLKLWGTRTLVLAGTVANICVHYTAASAALRWYDVVVVRDAVSALDPFDLQASLRQTAWLFAGRVADARAITFAG